MPFVTPEDTQSTRIDYLIAGGGTGGLAVAARLSEDPNVNVLVVEAGPCQDGAPEVDIPGFVGRGIANPKFDWMIFSTPQKYANNRATFQPRGKGLGGSSFLNFTAMLRPSKIEMDAIETLGNKGWNWDSFLHYMKKSETLQVPQLSEADQAKYAIKPETQNYGTEGPIKISYVTRWPDVHSKMIDAIENIGVPRNPETRGGRNDGVHTSTLTVDSVAAKRSYAYPDYIKPNLHRPNLLLLTDTYVTKILLEKEGDLQRATGIQAVRNEKSITISGVRREVILACGSFQTPQVLELSGIGNPAVLSKFNIDTVIDLPGVGENLQDHMHIATTAEIDSADETVDDLVNPESLKTHQELYKTGKGFFSYVPAVNFVFLPGPSLWTDEEAAQYKARALAGLAETLATSIPAIRPGLKKQFAIQEKLLDDKYEPQGEYIHFAGNAPVLYAAKPEPGKRYTSLMCSVTHPFSRGTCHIASADPLAIPAVNPNYFANPADLDVHVRLVETALKTFKTSPLKEHIKEVVLPNKEIIDNGVEGLREFIKDNCGTTYHPVGTASMLPREDGGVVDPSLKVYGTSNLRVVDASIIPIELSTHIQSVVYAIGEKAADIIKAENASV